MRPIGWGLVATAVAIVLLFPVFIFGFIEAIGGEPTIFGTMGAVLIIVAIFSTPTAAVVEAAQWIQSKRSEEVKEKRKKRELDRLEGKDSIEKLDRLNDLRGKGAISEEEFESKKQELLDKM